MNSGSFRQRTFQRRAATISARMLALAAIGLSLSTISLHGQAPTGYRDFQLGSEVNSVSALTGVAASGVRTLHQRPAVIQELEWRPPYYVRGSIAPLNDPVQHIVFSFYQDQLFRLVIDYARERTDGMTDADMIEAMFETYGSPLEPRSMKAAAVPSRTEAESGKSIARWGDADCSVSLYRMPYESAFRLIVTSPRLEGLARTANAEAIRLDEREAPQREIARQKRAVDDARDARDKARIANKAAFRP